MFLGTILSTPGAPCSRLPQDAGSRRLNVFRPIFIRFTLRAPPIEAVGPPKDSPHKSVKTGQTHLSCVDHRSNAQISTGPTSVTGKAVSSMNAFKTGIDAKSLVLPSENLADLEQLAADFYHHHGPASLDACGVVDDLIYCEWTLRRPTPAGARTRWKARPQAGLPAPRTRSLRVVPRI